MTKPWPQSVVAHVASLFLFFFVAIYHVGKWVNHDELSIHYSFPFLTIFKKEERHVGFRLPALQETEKRTTFEKALAKLGYLARYLGGQLPPAFIRHPGQKLLRLYQRDDLDRQFETIARAEAQYPAVTHARDFIDELKAIGVKVVVLLVPEHVGLALEKDPFAVPLGQIWATPYERGQLNPYGSYRALLEKFPESVDLFARFSKFQKEHPEAELYIPSDAHWSSLGINLAAQALLKKLVAGYQTQLQFQYLEPARYDYYLTQFLGLPDWFLKRRPEFQWHNPIYTLAPLEPAKAQLTPLTSRVILAGTSNSNTRSAEHEALADLLQKHLKNPVMNFSVTGGGMAGSLLNLEKQNFKFRKGDVFIWEFLPKHVTWRYPQGQYPFPNFGKEKKRTWFTTTPLRYN